MAQSDSEKERHDNWTHRCSTLGWGREQDTGEMHEGNLNGGTTTKRGEIHQVRHKG